MKFITKNYTFTWSSSYQVTFEILEERDDFLHLLLKIDFLTECIPQKTSIHWSIPCTDIFSQWNPHFGTEHTLMPEWNPIKSTARLAFGEPIQCHMDMKGINRLTAYLSDVRTPTEISTGIKEEDASLQYKLTLFRQPISPVSSYATHLILDSRRLPYNQIIKNAEKYWDINSIQNNAVPENAKSPMYSSWYNWHQDLNPDKIIEELKSAKEMGMETIIVDDGWQTDNNSRGYAYCGDWEPNGSKIPDMKKFVESVHSLGLKYIMWYSVPFIGVFSKAYDKFKNRFLNEIDGKYGILDPRYPDVREYLCTIYEKAVTNWNIDGLKLDFIDSFELSDKSNAPNELMDNESLEDGIYALLCEIKNRLTKIKPDIMLEFRQNYIGPAMRSVGNIFRVADCPADPLRNRVNSLSLRLSSGNSVVHSDMLMWNMNESPESAALQLLNVMFCVPQISVKLNDLPVSHKKMLTFYLSLWRENQECILNGELFVENPESNYSLVYSVLKENAFAVSFSKNTFIMPHGISTLYFINASWNNDLLIKTTSPSCTAIVTIFACTGEITEETEIQLKQGYNAFSVPKSGLLKIVIK